MKVVVSLLALEFSYFVSLSLLSFFLSLSLKKKKKKKSDTKCVFYKKWRDRETTKESKQSKKWSKIEKKTQELKRAKRDKKQKTRWVRLFLVSFFWKVTEDDVINVGKSITALSSLVNVQTHKDARRNLSLSLSLQTRRLRLLPATDINNTSGFAYFLSLLSLLLKSVLEFEKIKER